MEFKEPKDIVKFVANCAQIKTWMTWHPNLHLDIYTDFDMKYIVIMDKLLKEHFNLKISKIKINSLNQMDIDNIDMISETDIEEIIYEEDISDFNQLPQLPKGASIEFNITNRKYVIWDFYVNKYNVYLKIVNKHWVGSTETYEEAFNIAKNDRS